MPFAIALVNLVCLVLQLAQFLSHSNESDSAETFFYWIVYFINQLADGVLFQVLFTLTLE